MNTIESHRASRSWPLIEEEDVDIPLQMPEQGLAGGKRKYIPKLSRARCVQIKLAARHQTDGMAKRDCERVLLARKRRQTERAVSGFPWLKLVKYSTGHGSYVLRFRSPVTDLRDSMVIGDSGKLTLGEIAVEYQRLRTMIANGRNPRLGMLTVREFVVQHYANYAASLSSGEGILGRFRKHVAPAIGDKLLTQLTAHDLQFVVDSVDGNRKPATVRHVAMVLKSICRKAREWGFITGEPAKNLSYRRVQNQRGRVASADELRALFAALEVERDRLVVCLIRFLLATGVRLSEALGARWADVDMTRGILVLKKTKNGKTRPVNLSAAALAVCTELDALRANEFLFPGRGASGHMQRPTYAWKRLTERAGISDLWLHDLRRTVATVACNEAGVPIYTIAQMLGHSSVAVTSRYAVVADASVRAANEKVSSIIFEAAKKGRAE